MSTIDSSNLAVNSLKPDHSVQSSEAPVIPGGITGKTQQITVNMVCPKSLTVHPEVAAFPGLSDEDFRRLQNDITERKQILEPLRVNPQNQILDGRHRHLAATAAGLVLVPVIVDDSSDPLQIAIASAVARRQLTKSGIALVVYLKHPELQKDKEGRRLRNLKHGATGPESLELSYRQLAAHYSVPLKYFTYLGKIQAKCAKHPEKWAEACKTVLSGETDLPRLYAGLGSSLVTKGNKRTEPNYFELLKHTIATDMLTRLKERWRKFSETEQRQTVEIYCDTFEALPDDFRKAVIQRLQDQPAKKRGNAL